MRPKHITAIILLALLSIFLWYLNFSVYHLLLLDLVFIVGMLFPDFDVPFQLLYGVFRMVTFFFSLAVVVAVLFFYGDELCYSIPLFRGNCIAIYGIALVPLLLIIALDFFNPLRKPLHNFISLFVFAVILFMAAQYIGVSFFFTAMFTALFALGFFLHVLLELFGF